MGTWTSILIIHLFKYKFLWNHYNQHFCRPGFKWRGQRQFQAAKKKTVHRLLGASGIVLVVVWLVWFCLVLLHFFCFVNIYFILTKCQILYDAFDISSLQILIATLLKDWPKSPSHEVWESSKILPGSLPFHTLCCSLRCLTTGKILTRARG